ncbi:uncharacterized protein LOC126828161 [Patella vulgata]|uniref:uncharacterized protein LOC126828161 n=1 Tax=Patella vulgata TaxID=6465 RepID=UPI00217FC8B5|nr:uncharacterized protein LOC126828161 [Patella vulgata]XP_055958075.1 uncharacterized protein LOC126828161 [Patella vulgata]
MDTTIVTPSIFLTSLTSQDTTSITTNLPLTTDYLDLNTTSSAIMTTDGIVTITTEPTSTTTMATTTTVITTLLIACTKPPAVSNSLFTFTGYDVIYTCNSGFTMRGASRLDCDVTKGQWVDSPPSCSPLDLRPQVHNTVNIPETKEAIKTEDIKLIVAVLGGLLGLIALIGLLLFITHLCGCGTPICGGRRRPVEKEQQAVQTDRMHRKISNGDVRIFHSNVEHTFYDSGDVLVDLESGRYVVPRKASDIPNDDMAHQPNGSLVTNYNEELVHQPNVTNYNNFTAAQIRSNTMDFDKKRKGSVDVRSLSHHSDSPHGNHKLYRAHRKVQAVNSWMPHSRPIRNINTSTK